MASVAGFKVNLLFLRLVCKENHPAFVNNLSGPETPPGLETYHRVSAPIPFTPQSTERLQEYQQP